MNEIIKEQKEHAVITWSLTMARNNANSSWKEYIKILDKELSRQLDK